MKKLSYGYNLLLIGSLALISAPAYAYLDSGTGSVVIQLFFAGVAGFLAIVKLYWEKIKNFCRRYLRKSKPHTQAKHDKSAR